MLWTLALCTFTQQEFHRQSQRRETVWKLCQEYKEKYGCKPSDELLFMHSPLGRPPMVLGTGLGTTGTRSLFEAFVLLNYTSVHFRRYYNVPQMLEEKKTSRDLKKHKWSRSTAAEILNFFERTHSHNVDFKLLDFYYQHQIEFAIDEPVGFYWKELLQHYPGSKIIHTIRNESEWAASRVKHHNDKTFTKTFDRELDPREMVQLAINFNKEVICGSSCNVMMVLDLWKVSESKKIWSMLQGFLELSKVPSICFPMSPDCA